MLTNMTSAQNMETNTVFHVIKYTFYAQYFDSKRQSVSSHALFYILFNRFPSDSYSQNKTTRGPSNYNRSYAGSVKVL